MRLSTARDSKRDDRRGFPRAIGVIETTFGAHTLGTTTVKRFAFSACYARLYYYRTKITPLRY